MYLFDIEAYGWNCHKNITQFEGIEYGCLASTVETQHEDFALLFGEFLIEEVAKDVSHLTIIQPKITKIWARFLKSNLFIWNINFHNIKYHEDSRQKYKNS